MHELYALRLDVVFAHGTEDIDEPLRLVHQKELAAVFEHICTFTYDIFERTQNFVPCNVLFVCLVFESAAMCNIRWIAGYDIYGSFCKIGFSVV